MKLATRLALAAAPIGLAFATPAYADIVFYDTSGAIQPSENVLLPTGQLSSTITGKTNQTETAVTFQSLSCGATIGSCTTTGAESLTTPSNGQARIEATDGSLDALRFYLTGGQSFTQFELNLNKTLDAMQTIVLSVLEPNGEISSQSYALGGNGQNFFAGQAINGQTIQSVTFNASGLGASDIRQIRIGGISALTSAVPEPATWGMMLIGFAGIGLAFRRRQYHSGSSVRTGRLLSA